MGNLLGIVGRWVGRNLLSLLLIVAVLVAAGFFQKEIKAYLLTRDAVAALAHGKALLDADLSQQSRQLAKRTASFREDTAYRANSPGAPTDVSRAKPAA